MTKILFTILFVFLSQISSGQSLQFYTGKRDFLPIEIVMEDGSIKKGYAQDFMLPDVATFTYLMKSSEKTANLNREEVRFKSSKTDSDIQEIPVSEIKTLIYTNEDTQEKFQMDKRLVREINSSLELESEGRVLMLPLLEKGKINLYGYRSMFCRADFGDNFSSGSNGNDDNCQLQHVMIYVSKPNDTFAVAPVDYNKVSPVDLLNMKNLYRKFYKAYEIVGADCPEFLNKVNEARENDYFSNKTFKENKKAMEAERKEQMKGKKGAEAARINMKYKTELYINMYKKLLKDYESSCG